MVKFRGNSSLYKSDRNLFPINYINLEIQTPNGSILDSVTKLHFWITDKLRSMGQISGQ